MRIIKYVLQYLIMIYLFVLVSVIFEKHVEPINVWFTRVIGVFIISYNIACYYVDKMKQK